MIEYIHIQIYTFSDALTQLGRWANWIMWWLFWEIWTQCPMIF